ncbi:MAG: hypothetical protein R3B13_28515 [Polyangiaceae bacterium]
MLAPRQDPFPFEAVRDLLGIARAMYVAAQRDSAGSARLERLEKVGVQLRQAIDLALEHEPGTLGHAAAWQRAEAATRRLGELVDCTTPLQPTLAAAARRLIQARARRRGRRS